jgi:hypothetical protein
MKVTVPVGVPEPTSASLTVAVKVTGCTLLVVLLEETTVVVVLSLLTVWVSEALLPALSVSPP